MFDVLIYIVMQYSVAIFEQISCGCIKWLAILPRELKFRAAGLVSLSRHWGNTGMNTFGRENANTCVLQITAVLASRSVQFFVSWAPKCITYIL